MAARGSTRKMLIPFPMRHPSLFSPVFRCSARGAAGGLSTVALALLAGACGSGSSSDGPRPPNPGTGPAPSFLGIETADATSPTEVALAWSPASNASGPPDSDRMVYRIYRASSADAALTESALLATTAAGATSYLDVAATPFTAYFYRVEAVNSRGARSATRLLASAHTPSQWLPGSIDYPADIVPLWSTTSLAGNSCLSCHDGSPAGGRLDLGSYEGVLVGVGSAAAPDSFVVPGDGAATWDEFRLRFSLNPFEHLQFNARPQDIDAMEAPLTMWADEGALPAADGTPPRFAFENPENADRYFGSFVGDQVSITFFHASDPESVPFDGDTTGQLEYHVYGGVDSTAIDWLNPLASTRSNDADANPTMTVLFPWPHERGTFVVRAIDGAGRAVAVPDPSHPDYLGALALQRRNMSANEREIVLQR